LLAGEPGIGKTRLAEQAATIAEARGFRVLVARCREGEGAPAYWPWAQAVRAHAEAVDSAKLGAHLDGAAVEILQIVLSSRTNPRLAGAAGARRRAGALPLVRRLHGIPQTRRRQRAATARAGRSAVADKPTLLLLLFVAREMADGRIVILGTYREAELRTGHPLADVLPSLRRERVFERIALRGLADDQVLALVAELSRGTAPDPVAAAIARETEGNPLFVEEMVRHLRERDDLRLPASIREAIQRRLHRLHPSCLKLLEIASVIGRSFDVDLLGRLHEVDAATLLDRLDEARAARILDEERGTPGGCGSRTA